MYICVALDEIIYMLSKTICPCTCTRTCRGVSRLPTIKQSSDAGSHRARSWATPGWFLWQIFLPGRRPLNLLSWEKISWYTLHEWECTVCMCKFHLIRATRSARVGAYIPYGVIHGCDKNLRSMNGREVGTAYRAGERQATELIRQVAHVPELHRTADMKTIETN